MLTIDKANGVAKLASIRKTQSAKGARWRAQIRRKGYEQQSAYFDRKGDAETWARQIEAGIDAGKHPIGSEAKKHFLADVIDRYIKEVLPGKKSSKDQRQQLLVWRGLLGDSKLSEITTNRLLKARDTISKHDGRSGGLVSNATINRYWAALNHVLEISVREYGRIVAIPYGRTCYCPIKYLNTWSEETDAQEGAVFRSCSKGGQIGHNRLSVEAVAVIVKKTVAKIGLDPAGYSGHSLRAGYVTSAIQAGASEYSIRRQTGHASSATMERYIRLANLFEDNPTGLLF